MCARTPLTSTHVGSWREANWTRWTSCRKSSTDQSPRSNPLLPSQMYSRILTPPPPPPHLPPPMASALLRRGVRPADDFHSLPKNGEYVQADVRVCMCVCACTSPLIICIPKTYHTQLPPTHPHTTTTTTTTTSPIQSLTITTARRDGAALGRLLQRPARDAPPDPSGCPPQPQSQRMHCTHMRS